MCLIQQPIDIEIHEQFIASITALYKMNQQKVHWSSLVRHSDVYMQGRYSSIVHKQFNLETYFSFFLLNRKQMNSEKNIERKLFFKHQTLSMN